MLLFKPVHIPMIQDGRKTQTRRLWPHGCRVKAGSIHQCRTRMLDATSTFARVKILRVWREPLRSITESDAKAEGYAESITYLAAFYAINRGCPALYTINKGRPWNPLVWAVEFKRVELPHA